MALTVIQLPKGKPFFTQRNTLSDQDYTLRFEWNSRSGWYLGLAQGNDVLFHPRKIVVNQDLLQHCRHLASCPPGALWVYDITEQELDPGFEDFVSGPSTRDPQGRVYLLYQTVD
jgi:hypothetical protein